MPSSIDCKARVGSLKTKRLPLVHQPLYHITSCESQLVQFSTLESINHYTNLNFSNVSSFRSFSTLLTVQLTRPTNVAIEDFYVESFTTGRPFGRFQEVATTTAFLPPRYKAPADVNSRTQSHVKNSFSSNDDRLLAEQIYRLHRHRDDTPTGWLSPNRRKTSVGAKNAATSGTQLKKLHSSSKVVASVSDKNVNTLEHQLGIQQPQLQTPTSLQQQQQRKPSGSGGGLYKVPVPVPFAYLSDDDDSDDDNAAAAQDDGNDSREADDDTNNAAVELLDELDDDAQVFLEVDDNDCDNMNVWQLQNGQALNAFSSSRSSSSNNSSSGGSGGDNNNSVHRHWSLTFRDINVNNDDNANDKPQDNITVYFR